jgi:hypothetical protein
MGRWRARLGLGAIVAALASAPALAVAPALAWPTGGVSASLAPTDTAVLQVSPSAVQVSRATTFRTGVTLGPGQQVSITYAAATASVTAGPATFTTTERPDGTATLAALHESPEVTVAPPAGTRGRMSDWLPILLVVTGLVLAAATAALLAFRPLRRGAHPVPGGTSEPCHTPDCRRR